MERYGTSIRRTRCPQKDRPLDKDGDKVLNKSIPNTPNSISESFGGFPKDAKMIMESSAVWKAPLFAAA